MSLCPSRQRSHFKTAGATPPARGREAISEQAGAPQSRPQRWRGGPTLFRAPPSQPQSNRARLRSAASISDSQARQFSQVRRRRRAHDVLRRPRSCQRSHLRVGNLVRYDGCRGMSNALTGTLERCSGIIPSPAYQAAIIRPQSSFFPLSAPAAQQPSQQAGNSVTTTPHRTHAQPGSSAISEQAI